MVDHPLVRALESLAWEVPLLVMYGAGMVAALVYWRRFPRPCLLTFLGSGLLLATTVWPPVAYSYIEEVRRRNGDMISKLGWLSHLIYVTAILHRTVGVGLLVTAVFSSRSQGQKPDARGEAASHTPRHLCFGVAFAALGLYGASLASPAVYADASILEPGGFRLYSGLECLLVVWIGPPWLANPVFALGIIFLLAGHPVPGGLCGLIGLLWSGSFCLHVLRDFEEHREPLRFGYCLWVSSMAVLASSLLLPCFDRAPHSPS
jgi:hypothetical protein